VGPTSSQPSGSPKFERSEQQRIDRAHLTLHGLTVTTVAYQWGFRGSSRFAIAYRQAHGVTPSRTLRED
jgi:AraC-like DNA-binding protein